MTGKGEETARRMEEGQMEERLEDVRDYRNDGMYGRHKSGNGNGLDKNRRPETDIQIERKRRGGGSRQ